MFSQDQLIVFAEFVVIVELSVRCAWPGLCEIPSVDKFRGV